MLDKIPIELWTNIFKYSNVSTISKCNCLNRYFNNIIDNNLWMLIDNLYNFTDSILIPKTINTFYKYRYLVDWGDIILYNQQFDLTIPEDVILWIPDNVDLEAVVLYQSLSENVIRHIYHRVSWSTLLANQHVPLDIIYGIIQDTSMHMNNEYWLKILKIRNGQGKNSRCLYRIDYSYMRLIETDTIVNTSI